MAASTKLVGEIGRTEMWIAALACLIAAFAYFYRSSRRKWMHLPPMCQGWIPWLGCAVEFGKAPLHFIAEKQREVNVPKSTLLYKS